MSDLGFLFVAMALCLVVVAVLVAGLKGIASGGNFNRRHGNRMMRWRIIVQAAAIVAIIVYVIVRGNRWSF